MKEKNKKQRSSYFKDNILVTLIFNVTVFLLLALIFIFKNSFALSSEDTTPPRTPQNLEIKTKMNGFDLNWKEDGEKDIFTYLIYLRTGDEKEDKNPINVGKNNQYSIEKLNPGITYYISLAAKDNAGNISKATQEVGISPDISSLSREYSVSAWMPIIDMENAKKSFLDNLELFNYISPFELKLEPDGNITKVGEIFDQKLKDKSRSASIKIIPSITNNFDENDIASNLLQDDNLVQNHINNILTLVEKENFDGIDIDYENLKPEVKDKFTNFLRKLSEGLHNQGKILSVSVQAKKAEDNLWRGPGAVDFEALGKIVDQCRIMAYDYSRLNTPPGPISPINWFREVIIYAKKYIPKEKIIAGVPFYGYKWCLSGESCEKTGLVFEGVQNVISQYNPKIEWNAETKAPWFLYIDNKNNTSVINFENHQSLKEKLKVVQDEEIAGVSIWRLGSEDQQNFDVLKEAFNKEVSTPKGINIRPENQKIHLTWQKETKDKLFGYRIKIYPKDQNESSTPKISKNKDSQKDISASLLPATDPLKQEKLPLEEPLNQNKETVKEGIKEQSFDLIDKEEYDIINLENDQTYYISLIPLKWNNTKNEGFIEEIDKAKILLVTPSDLVYPEKISDLKIESVGNTTADLSFSAPGDDYLSGKISKHEIRYSDKPFNEENFEQAKVYPYSPLPEEPHSLQKWQLRDLEPGVKYYTALRSFDEKGNYSNISDIATFETIDNIPPKTPKSPEILSGNKSLFIKWENSPDKDVAGYKIFWKQEKSYYQIIEVDAKTTTYLLSNLENNYNYYASISAFDERGNESSQSGETRIAPRASNLPERIGGTLKITSEKAKAQASIFSQRFFSQGAVPYLIMFSVIIINVIIYHSVKREVQRKIDKSLVRSINKETTSKIRMIEVKKSNRKVLKF